MSQDYEDWTIQENNTQRVHLIHDDDGTIYASDYQSFDKAFDEWEFVVRRDEELLDQRIIRIENKEEVWGIVENAMEAYWGE